MINTPTGSGARTDGYEIRTRRGPPRDPLRDDDDRARRRRRARSSPRARATDEPVSLQELHGIERGSSQRAARERLVSAPRRAGARAVRAPRAARSSRNRATGGYRIVSALDREGPEPAAGPVLHARRRATAGASDGGRPVPAARVLGRRGRAGRRRRPARLPARGGRARAPSGSRRSSAGERLLGHRPARPAVLAAARRSSPDAAGAILVGGGIGIAPLAILAPPARRARRAAAGPARLPRPKPTRAGSSCFAAREVRLASEDGHAGHRGYVTDLLAVDARGRRRRPAPSSTPAARRRCSRRCGRCAPSARSPAELAMESPMACGFGACFGCAVPLRGGGYMRLCVDGPVRRRRPRSRRRWSPGAGH